MKKEEIKALIAAKIAGQGNQVDAGGALPTILDEIIDAIQQADWNEADSTKPDFIKNKPTIPAAQVQADWNEADDTKPDYIKNKPTIPAAQVQADFALTSPSSPAFIKNKPFAELRLHDLLNSDTPSDLPEGELEAAGLTDSVLSMLRAGHIYIVFDRWDWMDDDSDADETFVVTHDYQPDAFGNTTDHINFTRTYVSSGNIVIKTITFTDKHTDDGETETFSIAVTTKTIS